MWRKSEHSPMKFSLLPVQFMLGYGIKNEKISD